MNTSGGIFSKIGFNAGFFLDYYFIDNIALSSGVSYLNKGFVIKKAYDITMGFKYSLQQESRVNLNYVDIPFLLKYNLNKQIVFSGGLLLSFLESENVLVEINEVYEINENETVTENTSEKEDYNDVIDDNSPHSLLTGLHLGISYKIKRLDLSLRFNRNSSFGSVSGKSNNHNIILQFCTGFYF